MLIPRVIPCLLLDGEEMVKTVAYRDARYIGDPVNVVNLFNQFEVDEIVLLDIGATRSGRSPDIGLIRELAEECWVPLAYGGGITTLTQVREILGVGIEKVVLGTAAAETPTLVTEAAGVFGVQAVVVSVDARRVGPGSYDTAIKNASRSLGIDPAEYARRMEGLGAGEILLNAVDRDGTMSGYDLELIRRVVDAVHVPVVASCGAGSRDDLARPIREAGVSAVAAGSLFVYSGAARGVLINFPARDQLERLLS